VLAEPADSWLPSGWCWSKGITRETEIRFNEIITGKK